jgi:hypothetical protein
MTTNASVTAEETENNPILMVRLYDKSSYKKNHVARKMEISDA